MRYFRLLRWCRRPFPLHSTSLSLSHSLSLPLSLIISLHISLPPFFSLPSLSSHPFSPPLSLSLDLSLIISLPISLPPSLPPSLSLPSLSLLSPFISPPLCLSPSHSFFLGINIYICIHVRVRLYEWLEGYLASLSNTSATWWTGLNDRNVEGVWKWADDSQTPPDMSLIKWNGQPDNKNGNENCAAIFYEGRYADLNCNTPASFICKKSLTGGANKIQTNTFSFLFLVTAFSTLLLK
ncbi:unnamed protein product [Acanthosepion pharaonis]|uniref:C-type lectin domain-containing protein n=1 Tax=Acanthosepion pharaonis TaxID=158019 RepID=A0A812CPV2_ACAPH|nr:unnamed protein product [Sepia pharaonis]